MNAKDLTYQLGGNWKNGRGQAPCPLCQPERRQDQRALSICEGSNGKLLLWCFKSACSFVEIANTANIDLGAVQIDFVTKDEADKKRAAYTAEKLRKARRLWDHAKPMQGTRAEAYLRSRGITCDLPASLRFVSDAYHAPSMTWGCAMVADVRPTGGVHRTYLSKKGDRLSKSSKLMLGPCAGGAVRLSGADGPLVVCEGIETGLSLLSGLLSGPASVWAALSTSGLKALELPPEKGRLIVATDGDAPGREAGDSIANRAVVLGWNVSMLPAPDGNDWNDILMVGKGVAA